MTQQTSVRVTSRQAITCNANSIQSEESDKTKGSILFRSSKTFESIDNNMKGRGPRTIYFGGYQ